MSRRKDPIDTIVWTPAEELHPNDWNPNRVLTAELVLLERSLLSTGWIQPILANPDGRLSQDSKACRSRWNGLVPVARLKVDTATAMAITVRINRAKGSHGALEMAALAHSIINDHGWTKEKLAAEIGADSTEVDLLLQDGVFTAKGIDRWAYSPSWYPVLRSEVTEAEATEGEVVVERDDDPADLT